MNLKKQINEIIEVKKFNKMIRNFIKNLDPNNPEDKIVINYLNSLKFNLKDTILYNFTKNLFKKMIITTEIRYRQIQSLSEEEKEIAIEEFQKKYTKYCVDLQNLINEYKNDSKSDEKCKAYAVQLQNLFNEYKNRYSNI